jgi:uncharacterized membrane protein
VRVYALLKAVHVLAVVLWVGGMAFAHFFLRPALATLEPAQRLRLMHAVLRRFFAAVLLAVALVLASGLWMIGRVARQAAQGGARFDWPPSWVLMTALGLLMMAIFGHIRFVLYRRFVAAVDRADVPAGAAALARIRGWVSVNLALGVGVIVGVLLL